MNSRYISLQDNDLYEVSGKAIEHLRAAGTTLPSAELQILVLLDGQTTVARIAERLELALEAAPTTFADLLRRDLIRPASGLPQTPFACVVASLSLADFNRAVYNANNSAI